ncbi:hypothetical protein [Aestuariirhabdus sp. LZHN29]|uniref:hypothetical protein n=1 Tax=Aestuariirhabdus sp. LZHN29 TaxID=3417462 RepID=UPI003CEB6862
MAVRRDILFALGLIVALCAITALFGGGLKSDFYLDDFPNLSVLSSVSMPGGFWFATLQNASSALGRPLTMFSFALQAESWPSDPAAFKRINLLIHLFNTLLVAMVSQQLFALRKLPNSQWLALAVALLWAIAPLHLSSVLYVIQRMSLLAATFSLLGVALYLRADQLFAQGRWRAGYLRLTLGYGACLLFGVLAKENAILLPTLLLLLDGTLCRQRLRPPAWKRYQLAFLWLPLVMLALYLVFFSQALNYSSRPFDMGQRLLTEGRVMFHYLAQFLWPVGPELGLYHDDFPLSRGWLYPVSTLIAASGWLLLISAALGGSRHWPVLSFVTGWYLLAQLLESSVISLEIYFEHRTYLPMVGVCWGIIFWGERLLQQRPSMKRLVLTGFALYLLAIASVTWQQAHLWSQPLLMAAEKMEQHPNSERARLSGAQQLLKRGEGDAAVRLLLHDKSWSQLPASRQGRLLLLSCSEEVPLPNPGYWQGITYSREIIDSLQQLLGALGTNNCPRWPIENASQLLVTLQENPAYSGRHAVHFMQAKLALLVGDLEEAKTQARAANQNGRPDVEWMLIDIALSTGDREGAAIALEQAQQKIDRLGWRSLRYRPLLKAYRQRINGAPPP